MKLCVIGARGQLGQEFAKLVAPVDLLALDHGEVDVTDLDSLRAAMQPSGFDCVVNLAAFHDVNASELDPGPAFAVNAIGARNVATVARERQRKVVFISSDYVFGGGPPRTDPYTESQPPSPLNAYGVSKLAGELLVVGSNPNHLIVRSSSLFGCTTSRKGWTFPELMLNKARSGAPLRVVQDQVMTPTYTRDLATRILDLLRVDAQGVYHVVNAGEASWFDLACETLRQSGLGVEIEPVMTTARPPAARRPGYSVLASERLEHELEPLRDWRQALAAYLAELEATRAASSAARSSAASRNGESQK